MKYQFKQFIFDSDSQLLTEHGNVIALNQKGSMLLTLFLSDPNKLFTKADILAYVWPNKFVSDQVVFQNISHLRSLFGNESIKTHIKKGYQWQLALTTVEDETITESTTCATTIDVQTSDVKTTQGRENPSQHILSQHIDENKDIKNKKSQTAPSREGVKREFRTNHLIFIIAVTVVVLLASLIIFSSQQNTVPKQNLIFTSSAQSQNDISALKTVLNDTYSMSSPVMETTAQQIFDSPFHTWQRLKQSDTDLIFAFKLFPSGDSKVVRFHIQGKQRGWQGYLHLTDNKHQSEFEQLIKALKESNYFQVTSDNTALAELTLLGDKYPNNKLIQMQLIAFHIEFGNYDFASALADKYLATTSNLNQGLLYLYKAKSTMENEQWHATKNHLTNALAIFTQLELAQLEAHALIEFAWVHYIENTPIDIMGSLNKAARKARESNEPILELKARLLHAYLASKLKQFDVMHTQLDNAENLLQLHNITQHHKLPIYSTLAWSKKEKQDALPYYSQLITQPYAPLYKGILYNAARHVREINIKLNKWQDAEASLKPWQRASFQHLTHAHIAFAQGNTQLGFEHATHAFNQAQVEHHLIDALDAALLAISHSTNSDSNDQLSELKDFISQNATNKWINQNKTQLDTLNLR